MPSKIHEKWAPMRGVGQLQANSHLADRNALDVEDQVGVGWDVRGSTLLAVCKRGGDRQATLTTSGHAGNTNVPALDDLADAELEGERLALLVGCHVVSSPLHICLGIWTTHSQRPFRSSACQCSASRHGRPSWQPCPCHPSCLRQ